MKNSQRLLLLIFSLLLSTSFFAQNKPLRNDTIYADAEMPAMSSKVSMEIDTKLFPRTQGSMFISENPRAMIMPMVLRAVFDSINEKKFLDETAKEMDMTIIKQGTMKKKGKVAYYVIGTTKDKERNIILEVYFVKADADKTIMVTGFYDKSAKKTFAKQIQNAAFSAKLE